ncbi:diversity-generating retroelement protein Avd [Cronbergia sp. UHCC 0137]|uniref:diversity-generating retroelement protein Avd n=1 Tax=Cronbergia sp. UHCC 0137 TaxID=3110239 RepID=UPI002B215879|nr:diversity-generating retroelement protein Avd [Cronbergia sp. UHCC 0137]MEA5616253.1 diversity-generating retroelement protein Avd [Cronbergia sp. UHCC 0137]
MQEPPIIQKTYNLIKWYVPILNRLPRNHKFTLGDRMVNKLYDILEDLIAARFASEKVAILKEINLKLDIIRYQTRLLYDFELIKIERYNYVSELLKEIGNDLGGWIKEQKIKVKL